MQMETKQLIEKLYGSDLESWMLVQRAYKTYAHGEEIMECGFNKMSGYVYIALENGVQIASCFGNPVEYIVYQHEQDEEEFFDTYAEAINSYKQ
jgi:hypothetical protein